MSNPFSPDAGVAPADDVLPGTDTSVVTDVAKPPPPLLRGVARVIDLLVVVAILEAAGRAMHAQERKLVEVMLHGSSGQDGLAALSRVKIIGGIDNPLREGLVSFAVEGMAGADVVSRLREKGIRVHVRKNDLYSGGVLGPLGWDSCVRVSLCHYNSVDEVERFLKAMRAITE